MGKHSGTGSRVEKVDADRAWLLLLSLRAAARQDGSIPTRFGLGCNSVSTPAVLEADDPGAFIIVTAAGGWKARVDLDPEAVSILDLYLPVALACARQPLVVAHLGVSLDGHVATHTGASHYITGSENIVHLHRLRALVDAVIVGAGTVEQDDPQLTTRRVTGNNAVRVIIDPARRLGRDFRVFSDGAAETLIFCMEERAGSPNGRHGAARIIGIPAGPSGLSLDALLARLRSLGLHGILVEGGGITVSRFLNENKLDRLQLAIAPLIIGSGRPGLVLPPIDSLTQALRPRCRHFRMGPDMLFDCDLRSDRR